MSRELNALVGAAVTVVTLTFVPFSPLVGGVVAGYLNGEDGFMVGTLSGVFALIPAFILVGFAGLAAIGIGFLSPLASGIIILILLFGLLFLLAYVIGLSAVGGYIGVYLTDEFRGTDG